MAKDPYKKDYIKLKPLSNKVFNYAIKLKKEIVFSPGSQPFSYLILIFKRLELKYGVTFEEMLLLFYLNELSVFSAVINIEVDNKMNISKFTERKLIVRDYTVKDKTLYKLSEYGVNIILEIRDQINDVDDFILYNREFTIDTHTKAKRIIKNIQLDGY